MNNEWARKWTDAEPSQLFVRGLKGILGLFLWVILVALLAGVAKTLLDLRHILEETVEVALRRVIIDSLILLAVVEVFRTILAYLTEGRVRVTFIVDTVIVVMLTEVLSLWFKGRTWEAIGSIALVILTLGVMRIIAVRYSPGLPGLKVHRPPDET